MKVLTITITGIWHFFYNYWASIIYSLFKIQATRPPVFLKMKEGELRAEC